MKIARSPSHAAAEEIEQRVLDLLRTKHRLMFPEIANAFPEYTWHRLLSALNRLRERRQVELLAHRWDYEVLLHNDHVPK
ncbi:MAG: hypothetical protein E6K63_11460 [Nitrospirae bacterium]|nr:MAG: hypothetical protein E6K63_11460 [Nitrospirota bacterium]